MIPGEVNQAVGLLKKKKKNTKLPRALRRRPQQVSIICAFCREPAPRPRKYRDVFSGGGRLGGRCACSAVYVIDETGRDGGQSLLDAQALVCDGDLDRAVRLDTGADCKVKIRELVARSRSGRGRARVTGKLSPKVWFLKRKN
jgi:hypothetical protein